jgi:Tfp pilus assembly protein PilW
MTILEMLLAFSLALVVFTVLAKATLFAARSYVALSNYNDLDQASQNALDTMSREIRQTTALTGIGTNGTQSLTFSNWDGGTLTYAWDPTTRNLVRKKTGQADRILLTQCDSLVFNVSQRNPSNNFTFYPASGTNTAKLVDITWTCSRQILQAKVNTESVQTAKIVLRN